MNIGSAANDGKRKNRRDEKAICEIGSETAKQKIGKKVTKMKKVID